MSTLRELLDKVDPYDGYLTPQEVEAWAYGTEVECGACGGNGFVTKDYPETEPCPTCHGTGKVRSGGLVERVESNATALALAELRRSTAVYPEDRFADPKPLAPHIRDALRAELGDTP